MNETRLWPAPHRATPLHAQALVPGSKSLTNRLLVLAALGDGPSVLTRPLASRDTDLMVDALASLGVRVERHGDVWTVSPAQHPAMGDIAVDCGLAGTVMRFVPPIAALTGASVTLDGDERARVRPMSTTITALRALGVSVDDGGRSALPFTIHGTGHVEGGQLEIDASASSQFVSALLLTAPRFEHGLDLRHTGTSLPSQPHVKMTVAELRHRGIDVDDSEPDRWVVRPGAIAARDADVEPDLSNAGPFVAAALATGGSVRVLGWPGVTTQAGDAWRRIAAAFGGRAERDGGDMAFTAGDGLNGVELDLHDVGELTPVVAALAALAESESRLTGVAHLRGHETDRLAALAAELNRLGGDVEELADGLLIRPRPLHGGVFGTYDDHRMAQAAVVLGLRVQGLLIENVGTTAKTYPDFATVWERLLA
ncbi:MAG: 3-phosphoshikimate 1-carboxyvinyltransferase [Aeromicrobium sp.]